ncbi:MAG TPA: hypothetical protein VG096_26225 [Bryobacteraceae bacterium]|jgi:hypothetical protein|nr:hypothetical protein [Bryobacteraceae bacterium]
MSGSFRYIELRVPATRFDSWDHFTEVAPEYSIGLEVIDDTPGHRGHFVHFDHHEGVVREATMSAAMQAYMAVRQGKLMQRWLQHRCPIPVYVWNADQDVCLAAFILEYHELLERFHSDPMLRWIVQFNNKIDVCGGLYPVDLPELVRNHFTWVFEPYRQQRMHGKTQGDEALVKETIRQVCDRLKDLLEGKAGVAPITAEPEILYTSPNGFVIADEKGDPNSRLVLASQGFTNLISLLCQRKSGRYTYSVIRGSPYDEDTFPVTMLVRAFQAAEDLPSAKIWGGSNMAAGSDSELGSSLHWTVLRDIADTIVRGAVRDSRPTPALVLTVGCREIETALKQCHAEVCRVVSLAEARSTLASGVPVQAMFCAQKLPDGRVSDLVDLSRQFASGVPVIVYLPDIDGGWSDLLEAGAADMITGPHLRDEVARVLKSLPRYCAVRPPALASV